MALADEKRNDAPQNLHTTIPITPYHNDVNDSNENENTFGDVLIVQNTSLPTTIFPLNENNTSVENAYETRYTQNTRDLWNLQLLNFLRHMTKDQASYLFIDVHFTAGTSKDLKSAADGKHSRYGTSWQRFTTRVEQAQDPQSYEAEL